MGKIRLLKTAFVSGELAQQVFGRIDKDFYLKGADKLRNVYVDPLGGVYKREGMKYVAETYDNGKAKIMEFAFNTEQTYLIVFTHQRMRVYKNDVLMVDISGNSILNNITSAILSEIKYAQSADTLIITHSDFQPIKITRTSDITWLISYIDFGFTPTYAFNGVSILEPDGSIKLSNLLGDYVTIDLIPNTVSTTTVLYRRPYGGSTGTRTTTTTVGTFRFNPSHVKQTIIAKTGGIFTINQYISPTQVIGNVLVEFAGDDSTTGDNNAMTYESSEWQLETGYEDVWDPVRGYPKSCCFYQGRLWFGGSKARPSTLWGSRSGLFFDFDTGSGSADDAIDVTIDDDKINAIVNIFPGRNLQIFTTGGEFYIPQSEIDPIKPENIMVQKSTQHGSNNVKPVSVDGGTIFIESSGKVVRQFLFNELERSYNAQSISLLSSQLIRNPVAMAVRQSRDESPADYVYVVNSDGTIAVLNVLRDEQLLAWSLFETKGIVEDLVVIVREVYLITRRTINGVEKRFIEKLDRNYLLDAGKKVTSLASVHSFSGFNHLASEEVKVRAESFVLLDNTVKSDGSIDIEFDYKEIEAGLGFSILVRTLPIDMDLGGKTLTGDWRRIVYAMVKTFNSRSFEVHCGRNVFRPVFRELGSNLLDTEITPYNGWKKIYMSGGIKRDAAFDIVQDEPTEFDLISMVIAVTI